MILKIGMQLKRDGKTYMLTLLSPRQVYKDQLKLKKVGETEEALLRNNGEDLRLSKNKVSL